MARRKGSWARLRKAIQDNDNQAVEDALLALSRRNRLFAPLGLVVGAFAMLWSGVRLLVTNWRLTLIQILPAMLIWGAMLDLKVHAFKGRSFNVVRGPILIPVILAITALTAAAYFLNAVFAFQVSEPGSEGFRSAVDKAIRHRRAVLGWGLGIGFALGFATTVSSRWGRGWFGLILGIVVAVMMFTYVTIPTTLIGVKSRDQSTRDRITTSAVSGLMSAIVCSPPYVLGRIGIVLLGTHGFFVLGLVLLIVAAPLQTGAVTATKALKFSSKLLSDLSGAGPPAHEPLEPSPQPQEGRSAG